MTATIEQCKCSMPIRVLGDGCRYCQPQEYINTLHEQIEDERAEKDAEIAELRSQVGVLVGLLVEYHESGVGNSTDYALQFAACRRSEQTLADLKAAAEKWEREVRHKEMLLSIAAVEQCMDSGDDKGIERDVYIWNRAVIYCATAIAKAASLRKGD